MSGVTQHLNKGARTTLRSLIPKAACPARLVRWGFIFQRIALDLCSPDVPAKGRETRCDKAQIRKRW